jgi:hypothetical protein
MNTSRLSITPPTASQVRTLDETGFLIIPGHFSPAMAGRLGQRFDELIAAEGDRAGLEVHQEPGTRRLANLVDKGACFDPVWGDPVVLGCVAHVLKRRFHLSSLNAREPLPGSGHQGLHADWGPHQNSEPFHVVNSLWLLDDLTAENGATRAVPGSHLRSGALSDHLTDPAAHHPDEMIVTAPAGSVVIFNAHCWHGGRLNRSGARRRIIHAYYVAEGHPQQCDFPALVSPATRARLNHDRRDLLGLDGGVFTPPAFRAVPSTT